MDSQVSVKGAKPDFVLPSSSYLESHPLNSMLLTAKRTLRERWRQVVTEANVTHGYYLATLDDNITEAQCQQMEKRKIWMVTTKDNIESLPHYISSHNVISFEKFFSEHLDLRMKTWPS